MKKFMLVGLLLMATLFMVHGEAWAKLPRDYQEFKARYEKEARTIEGAAHLYFEAVFCYLNEATRTEASKMLRYAMYLAMPIERSNNYATFVNRLKDESYHYIFRSFAIGATPENSYQMSPDSFKLNVVSKRKESDFTHLSLRSSGADNPRNVWMKEYDGLWYMINNAGTYAEVREPKSNIDIRRNAHDADYDTEGQWDEPPKNVNSGSGEGLDENQNDTNNDSGGSLDDLWH